MTENPDPDLRRTDIDVEFVRPEILYVLRRDVLRPGQPLTAAMHDYDFKPDTFHVAAFGPLNQVAACATFYPEPTPYETNEAAWRLRAMASQPELRGQGYGAAALRYGIAEIRRRGGTLLWCNARSGALGFYERIGFSTVGDEFEIESIGPHFVMEIHL
jgi:GNAT superfamily N-acetyltransferase